MPPRSERRRRERSDAPSAPSLFRVRELAIAAVVGGGLIVVLIAFLVFSGGGDNSDPPDELAIQSLAKESIEALARGEWPSLYDSFTPEFQQRCSRADFEAAGQTSAAEQGERLQRLRFVRLEDVSFQGDSASAVIVGEITGETEYRVLGAFQKVAGVWKVAPAANTSGCSAFDRSA
jgi:hypothetical protein